MRDFIETTGADLGSLNRFYSVPLAAERMPRLQDYMKKREAELNALPFETMDRDSQVDWILQKNLLDRRLAELDQEAKKNAEILPLLPQAEPICAAAMARQKMEPLDPKAAAAMLDKLADTVKAKRAELEKGWKGDKTVAFRASQANDRLRDLLKEWFDFYKGYDPLFTWWCAKPYEEAAKQVGDYSGFLKEKLVGIRADDRDAIVGNPIGREALLEALRFEMIPYTPEELIAIAEREYKWCEAEMTKAAKELGYSDWRQALEHAKNQYVSPGDQPQLIRKLALEAIDYVKKNDLVTVPPLAEETWRMQMMSPERQKVNPFFLGGESIIVSFPTDTMTMDEKLMSLRANNVNFARATVFHELIPGHHLQGYMEDRNYPYRAPFGTPFWVEGWALWWEFLLWDRGFAATPEQKIGMLFWRMHRCVRIVFSLSFHLGKMTPEECIKALIDRVGHEPSTAEGEVRRSFGGAYPPLYQAAYMLGALQIRSLAKECVGKGAGKMSYRQFHDAVLAQNSMPIEMLRSILLKKPLSRNFTPTWRFDDSKP